MNGPAPFIASIERAERVAPVLAVVSCVLFACHSSDSSQSPSAKANASAAVASSASASFAGTSPSSDSSSDATRDPSPNGSARAASDRPLKVQIDISLPEPELYPKTQKEQREAMLRRMKIMHRLTDAQVDALAKIIAGSHILGQGNPDIATYAMTRAQCQEARDAAHVVEYEHTVCGGPYMEPLYDPGAGQTESDATACIDEYEFPDMPCDYPVTWVSPREASQMCEVMGKRLCDAHEWEGACAGAVHDPDLEYAWGKSRRQMKELHNAEREIVWSYGPEADQSVCATHSKKSKTCQDSGYRKCGSNTYPSGSFPKCVSKLGVFDMQGNVAEHMNMPMRPSELESRGGSGETEMKGSWFVFGMMKPPHEDDCRWRAPDWHVTRVMSGNGHANYHLGFRCCKSVGDVGGKGPAKSDGDAPASSASSKPEGKPPKSDKKKHH